MHLRQSCPSILLAFLVAGCTRGDGIAHVPNVVTLTGDGTRFDAPDSVPAGLTTLRFVTRGPEPQQAALLRISGGHTYAEFLDAIHRPGPPPTWVSPAGGVTAPRPGDSAEVTLPLDRGSYALLSFLPSRDGAPQLVKGMLRELTVTRGSGRVLEPIATDTLVASEYTYATSSQLSVGRHTFLFLNRGSQPHEVAIFRLATGHSAADIITWIATQKGPAPGEPLGGVAAMRPDQHAYVTADLAAGTYAFICFLPDAQDGKPHHAHGQVREFTVR